MKSAAEVIGTRANHAEARLLIDEHIAGLVETGAFAAPLSFRREPDCLIGTFITKTGTKAALLAFACRVEIPR